MPEYTLKISDGYSTWVFELNGSDKLSIQMLLDNAIKDTGLYVSKEYIESVKNVELSIANLYALIKP